METYPNIIQNLPKINVPIKGVNGYLMQSPNNQLVFFEFTEDTEIPLHSHGAQWGIVVDGKIELTIGTVTKTYLEVEASCDEITNIPVPLLKQEPLIYPNPASNTIILSKNVQNVSIYNQVGQKVLYKNETSFMDISKLEQGLYVVVMETEYGRFMEKLVVR